MNQPLGHNIGNWLEVYESIKILNGERVLDLYDVSMNLSGAMIYLGGKAGSIKEGIEISKDIINSGKAFSKFLEIVKIQNGNTFYLKHPEKFPKTKYSHNIISDKNCYLKKVDTYKLGICALELGAGRFTKEDKIDPASGIIFKHKIGDRIKKGDVIAELFTNKEEEIEKISQSVSSSLEFTNKKVKSPKLIKKIIT
jgi:thymidine phosphorylase